MQRAIKINNVSHSFKENVVLRGINLEIKKGEIFGLLGPSGAGKTTLFNCLNSDIKMDAGRNFGILFRELL